ncbi:MAG: pseudouridine synthase [Thermoanaerobaculia bacterium]
MPARKLPPGDRPLKTLERVISKAGLGSRREARSWIAGGRAAVNGERVLDPDRWIDLERDRVELDGRPVEPKERRYLLLHKPAGTMTTYRDPEGRPTVYALLPESDGFLMYAGRLDRDTSGLLVMTNDASLVERLTNPRHAVPKRYRVTTSRALTDEEIERLRGVVELSDGPTRPARAERVASDERIIELTITEGRNRQVRRMIEAVGAEVVALERTAIGRIEIAGLAPGAVRELTTKEVESLQSGHVGT